MEPQRPITVIETPSFIRDAKKLLDRDEREALVHFLAYSPALGNLIKDTGGVRKIRWAREGEGKSGGYRVIYFFHSMETPLFLLNIFAKNEKENISPQERKELKKLTAVLVESYKSAGGKNEW
ncbi:MAG: type II toxin-antitoxin system RelE/ParE family toxin [Spirochaetaceae bacterium]|jgi:hypothetical protein|nr:type II toxin-antitoxin system RelE/ParE family toxin [Spirochaetaceae bacterium]